MTDKYGIFSRLLDSAVRNLAQAVFDMFEEETARIRAQAGLQETVIRRQIHKCCDWCAGLVGTYEYGTEPHEVWQRHANCRCIVIVKTSKGKYQDAWSKREYSTQREARIARSEEILKEEMMTPEERQALAEQIVQERRERYNARRRELYRQQRLGAQGTTGS